MNSLQNFSFVKPPSLSNSPNGANSTLEISLAMAKTSSAFGLIRSALSETFPELGWAPYILTGATDARFFDEVCGQIFRFAPVEYGPEQKKGIHGIDENLEYATLAGCVDFYRNLIMLVK